MTESPWDFARLPNRRQSSYQRRIEQRSPRLLMRDATLDMLAASALMNCGPWTKRLARQWRPWLMFRIVVIVVHMVAAASA